MRAIILLSTLLPASAALAKEVAETKTLKSGDSIAGLIVRGDAEVLFTGGHREDEPEWHRAELKLPAGTEWCGVPLAAGTPVAIVRRRMASWYPSKLTPLSGEKPIDAIDDSSALRLLQKTDHPGSLFLYASVPQPLKLGVLEVAPGRMVVECRATEDGRGAFTGVLQAALTHPYRWREFEIPAGTRLTWHPSAAGGGLAMWLRLDRDRTFPGGVRVPQLADLQFHANGQLSFAGALSSMNPNYWKRMTIEVPTAKFGKLPCRPTAHFHANGALAACRLEDRQTLKVGLLECSSSEIRWHDNGELEHCYLPTVQKIKGYRARGAVDFYRNGAPKAIDVPSGGTIRFPEETTSR